jgi:hypothetical protein
MTTIINIEPGTFGGPLRNGDLIGVANVVEHLRQTNDSKLQFHIKDEAISPEKYVREFYSFLLNQCDYFTNNVGTESLPWRRVNIWDFRDIIGDCVKIPNDKKTEFKIVVCPVFDAPYNTYRNWTKPIFERILKQCEQEYPENFERIICISPNNIINLQEFDLSKWIISTDFITNINHIMTTSTFIGGDTGTSHFAWSLDKGPKELIYYNSSRGLLHTLPFYLISGKGTIKTYWLDFEGTTWG